MRLVIRSRSVNRPSEFFSDEYYRVLRSINNDLECSFDKCNFVKVAKSEGKHWAGHIIVRIPDNNSSKIAFSLNPIYMRRFGISLYRSR